MTDRIDADNGFIPLVRGSVRDATPILDAPRPLAYLIGLRCVDDTLCGALDHALLEILITAAQEQDPSLQSYVYVVSVPSVLKILGSTVRRTELLVALQHLNERYFDLAALPISKGRRRFMKGMTLRPCLPDRLYALEDALADTGMSGRWLPKFLDRLMEDRGLGDDDDLEVKEDDVLSDEREEDLRDLEARSGIEYTDDPDKAADRYSEPRPMPEADFREEGGRVVFQPLSSVRVADDEIHYSLDSHLRAFLDPSRRVKGRRLPYTYLDVRSMTAFRSRYTAPLYRRVVAGTSETTQYPRTIRRKGRSPLKITVDGRRHRIGAWTATYDIDVVAGGVSYAWTAGGKAAQFKRGVLKQVQKDLATLPDTLRVDVSLADTPKGHPIGVLFSVHHLPRPQTIKSSAIPELQPEGERWTTRPVAPPDSPFYSVRLSTWASAATWLGCRSVSDLHPYVDAWHAAIGEIECSGEAHYGNLTRPELTKHAADIEIVDFRNQADGDNAAIWAFQERTNDPVERSCRFDRLKALIDEVGADRAVLAFVAEEYAHPDLTQIGIAQALVRDGTLKFYKRERERRFAASLDQPVPDALPRRRFTDGLARSVRDEKYTPGGRKLQTVVERIDATERERDEFRAQRRIGIAIAYNARRREARRIAREKGK